MTSRDDILGRLRSARGRPFPDAAPVPVQYQPVTRIDDTTPDGLLARFRNELTALQGEVYIEADGEAARARVVALLAEAAAAHTGAGEPRIACWHFRYIPIPRLYTTLQKAGYTVDYPHIHADDRPAELARLEQAVAGLTGVEAAIAATGTLVIGSGPGKSRIPGMLPPVHVAVVRRDQLLPRLEDWLARQRADGMRAVQDRANVCFITGPSRTADIEKQLVVGVHGPGRLQVVIY
ncbi:MAG: LutC/YkgG family protein [Chloroflexota bacterium]